MESPPVHLTIALPVYDGEATLREALGELESFVTACGYACEIVAVDDGSRDGTRRLLEDWAKTHPDVRVEVHPENRGKGAALKTAARVSRGHFLVTLDADATYDTEAIPLLVAQLEAGCDAAVGNRRDPDTQFILHPRHFAYIGLRHAMGRVFNWLARAGAGAAVDDTQCGVKGFRGDVARRWFPQVDDDHFAFDVELLGLLGHAGCRIGAVPVVYRYRRQPSTVNLVRDGGRMLAHLVRIRLKLMRLRRSGAFADHARVDYQHLAQREGHPIQRFWHQKKWPLVERMIDPAGEERVLDVGAGSSDIPLAIGARARAVAVDASLGSLRFLRGLEAERSSGRRVRFSAADVRQLPFRDGSFDKLVVLEVIEHLPEPDVGAMLSELRRVLAPGGRLLLTTPNYRSVWPLLEWLVDHFGGAAEMGGVQHLTRFHPRRLDAALARHGFRVLRAGSVYHLSPFLAPLAPGLADRLFRREMLQGGRFGPILYALAEAPG